jgi:hypothetical protein
MTRLHEARIGYAGYSPDFSAPGDRRRFCAYARHRGLTFERADLGKSYDLVLVTHNGDLPGWTARKRHEGDRLKLVFELVDSYFAQTNPLRRLAKGCARYAMGTDSRLSPDFMATLIRACETADAVICSTPEQQSAIAQYNRNVIVSFDWFDDELGPAKTDYRRGEKLRIVWEGQAVTAPNLLAIREPLNALKDRVELHLVTDPLLHRHFGRFNAFPTMRIFDGFECDVILHPWEAGSFSKHVTDADLAVIPIDKANSFALGKPDNKLVMLWKLGMPVLASTTPAYCRAMRGAGLDLTCPTAADWQTRLEAAIDGDSRALEQAARVGRDFAERAYSKNEFVGRFDATFASIGFGV